MNTDIALAKVLAEKFHAGQMYGNLPYTDHLTQAAQRAIERSN